MHADPRFYLSPRLAQNYAHHRPPVHKAIWKRIAADLPFEGKVRWAVDVGCGGGASTRVLAAYARQVVGVDPSEAMLRKARLAVPEMLFLRGRAEALPVPSSAYELASAAGSLNYADRSGALAEISRVLRANGCLVAYDFSTGRVTGCGDEELLAFKWFRTSFATLGGYSLDLNALPYEGAGLRLIASGRFAVDLPMFFDAYVEYLLGETNVEASIASGMSEDVARRICCETFAPVFRREPALVRFAASYAISVKPPPSR